MLRSQRDEDAPRKGDNKCEHPLSVFLSFLPVSFSLFFSLPCLHSLTFCERDVRLQREGETTTRKDFFFSTYYMVRFRDKKNESDDTDGVFAAVPEDIIAHRILARLDAISMFRFALSSKTNFERVFGDNKDGTTNPNNSIITKTSSSSSSSSTMMMVRRIKLLTWNVKRDDEQPILLPCVVGPSRDDDDDGRGLDCWWSSKTTRRRRTTMIARTIRKESPDVFCTQEETRRMCARLQKETTTNDGVIAYAHFCETKEDERKQMYRELKEKDDVFVTLKREEEEDVDAYERAREEGADDDERGAFEQRVVENR